MRLFSGSDSVIALLALGLAMLPFASPAKSGEIWTSAETVPYVEELRMLSTCTSALQECALTNNYGDMDQDYATVEKSIDQPPIAFVCMGEDEGTCLGPYSNKRAQEVAYEYRDGGSFLVEQGTPEYNYELNNRALLASN